VNIAIIGTGHIGGGLGRAWSKKGHEVIFGTRNVADPDVIGLCQETGAQALSPTAAVATADIVVLAVPHAALEDVLRQTGALAGKIVIDCTNGLSPGPSLKFGHTTSAVEETAKQIPQARLVKSFNAQGAENLVNPVYNGVQATNFFCGDDADAKRVVKGLIEDVGFEAVDVGPLRNARFLEPLTLLWISATQALGTRQVAFKLLRR
jgi:predicted dinucleotide-binding enzyme